MFGSRFVMQYLESFLSVCNRLDEKDRGCCFILNCVLAVMTLLVFYVSSSRCRGLVCDYSKTCAKRPLSKRPKNGFQYQFSPNAGLMQVKSIAKGSILQYFRPSLSYHLALRSLFCLLLSGRFTHLLLYIISLLVCDFLVILACFLDVDEHSDQN